LKILYIHQYFKTPEEGGAIRSYTIAKKLVEAGHTIIMITSHNQNKVVIKDIRGIRVHYLPVPYDNKMGIGRRLYSFAHFYRAAYRQAKMVADVDLVYATSTPLSVGLLARTLKSKVGLPYFFEVRDLWPDAPFELGPAIPKLIKRRVHQLERKVYEDADHIIALSPSMEKRVKLRSPDSEITMIPNISDLDLFLPSRLWQTNPIQISYFGAVGKVNGLSHLIPLAKHCQKLSLPIQFNIYGTGSEQLYLEKQASTLRCHNLKLHGHLNKEDLNSALQNTAIALISLSTKSSGFR
jgi:glycosyltransferase involved in cell wall biosynthesis